MDNVNDPNPTPPTPSIGQQILDGKGRTAGHIARRVGCDPSAVWRWMTKGVKRNGRMVKLESVKIGNTMYTSDDAFLAFVAACSAKPPAPEPRPERPTRPRADPRRMAEFEAAAAEARSFGV